MKYVVVLSAVFIGTWFGTGADGARKPPSHPSTNPCTLNKGECYSIQGQSPSADQCVERDKLEQSARIKNYISVLAHRRVKALLQVERGKRE